MVSRIKIRVKTDGVNINLPGIPFSLLSWGSKIALRILKSSDVSESMEDDHIEYENDIDTFTTELSSVVVDDVKNDPKVIVGWDGEDTDVEKVLEEVVSFFRLAKPVLKDMDPFVLLEVQTNEAYIRVEVL